MNYIRDLTTVSLADIPLVGGKTASLGEMLQELTSVGVKVPQGFAITASAYRDFLAENHLLEPIKAVLAELQTNKKNVGQAARAIRDLIMSGKMMPALEREIADAYGELARRVRQDTVAVAVRSSATAEDLPTASFAGQQDTYLNVVGNASLLEACKACFASLFTERAMVYRQENHFDHMSVALSICVQQMVRSDKGAAGIVFTLDTESGFKDLISISATYGLGESIVQGRINPDEYLVYKKALAHGQRPIVRKSCGSKAEKLIFSDKSSQLGGTEWVPTTAQERTHFVLKDEQILELAALAVIIEDHYSKLQGAWKPMDIEWAQDGIDGTIYIVQARPETIYGSKKSSLLTRFQLKPTQEKLTVIARGQSVGQRMASGRARIVATREDLKDFKKGDILITPMTDPDWVAVMKQASAIVTDFGGRTCHAAIVSRELGIPAVVGTGDATKKIHEGQEITVDCSQGSQGFVYEGVVPFEIKEYETARTNTSLPCSLYVNLADPRAACAASLLPVQGVGLARLEFIVNNEIGIHPMAVTNSDRVTDKQVVAAMQERAAAYPSVEDFYVQTLARSVALIAAAFYPRPVIVRLSDFKSNEYRHLLGGSFFEPVEENPMLGWRGASRYIDPAYASAFALECKALKLAYEFGFSNIKLMIPFVRTVDEAKQVVELMARNGIERGKNGVELYMMVEIPANVLLLEKFAPYFDGFSIGSNDLTQLTLGVDRDSGLLSSIFDERNEAVMMLLAMAIAGAKKVGKPIGICGQAPSDYPEIAQFLIEHKIDSLSLSVDAVLPFIERHRK